jgi:hypothetical protein
VVNLPAFSVHRRTPIQHQLYTNCTTTKATSQKTSNSSPLHSEYTFDDSSSALVLIFIRQSKMLLENGSRLPVCLRCRANPELAWCTCCGLCNNYQHHFDCLQFVELQQQPTPPPSSPQQPLTIDPRLLETRPVSAAPAANTSPASFEAKPSSPEASIEARTRAALTGYLYPSQTASLEGYPSPSTSFEEESPPPAAAPPAEEAPKGRRPGRPLGSKDQKPRRAVGQKKAEREARIAREGAIRPGRKRGSTDKKPRAKAGTSPNYERQKAQRAERQEKKRRENGDNA